MSQIKKLAGQTVIYGLSTMLGRFLNYLLVYVHTQALGTVLYGKLTYFYSNTAIFLVLLTFGLETGFFRFASKKEEDYGKTLGTTFFSVLFTSSLFIITSIVLKEKWQGYFQIDNFRMVGYFIAIISLDVISAIPFAKLRIDERPVKFMFIKLSGIAINIGLNLFYLILCRHYFETGRENIFARIYNPELALDYVLIANLIGSGITFLLLVPEIFSVKPQFDFELLKRILRYSFPILLIGLAGMLNDQIGNILIPKLIKDSNPMAQLGIYGANFKLAVLMVLFIQMFRYAAEPFFFKNASDKNAKKLYADVMNYFVVFGLLIFLGVMFYIDILKYFIEAEFREGLFVVPILLIAKLVFGILFSLSIWYKVTDKTYFGILIAAIGAIITVVLNVILLPRIGYVGSAYANLASYITMLVVSYLLSRKHYLISYNFKKIGFYFISAFAIYAFAKYLALENTIVKYTVHTCLIFVFIAIAYYMERKSLKIK